MKVPGVGGESARPAARPIQERGGGDPPAASEGCEQRDVLVAELSLDEGFARVGQRLGRGCDERAERPTENSATSVRTGRKAGAAPETLRPFFTSRPGGWARGELVR